MHKNATGCKYSSFPSFSVNFTQEKFKLGLTVGNFKRPKWIATSFPASLSVLRACGEIYLAKAAISDESPFTRDCQFPTIYAALPCRKQEFHKRTWESLEPPRPVSKISLKLKFPTSLVKVYTYNLRRIPFVENENFTREHENLLTESIIVLTATSNSSLLWHF